MSLLQAFFSSYRPFVVTISGESGISDSVGSGTAFAGIRVNTDGTIDKREGGTYTQIDTATDWVRPTGRASSTFDVRANIVSETEDGFNAGLSDLFGTWLPMSTDREWVVTEATTGFTSTGTLTLLVRYNNSATLDSANYSMSADKF